MHPNLILSLAPLGLLGLGSLLVMLQASFRRSNVFCFAISFVFLIVALITSLIFGTSPMIATELFVVDRFGLISAQLLLALSAVVCFFSFEYFRTKTEFAEEFCILFLLSVLGALTMVFSNHFFSLFLGIELLTIPMYALVAYFHERSKGIEAAVKYIVLAGASAGLVLLGMVFLYAKTGVMRLDEFIVFFKDNPETDYLLALGFSFLTAGFFFKISGFPFHMWTPDVYEGAPLPVTLFLSTVSKAAAFVLFLRVFVMFQGDQIANFGWIIAFVAMTSMFVGNLLALTQVNLKRILAYSSVGHAGYMLAVFLVGNFLRAPTLLFYLAAYSVSLALVFGVLLILETKKKDIQVLEDIQGLFFSKPLLSSVLLVGMLSFAGIPLTAGFTGKFLVILASASSANWLLVFGLIISSAIGLCAYLRVILAMFVKKDWRETRKGKRRWALGFALFLLLLMTIFLGMWPNPSLSIAQQATLFIF